MAYINKQSTLGRLRAASYIVSKSVGRLRVASYIVSKPVGGCLQATSSATRMIYVEVTAKQSPSVDIALYYQQALPLRD